VGRRAKPDCPVERTLEMLSGKWKANILFHLLPGTKRSGELRRLMPGVTPEFRPTRKHDHRPRKRPRGRPPRVCGEWRWRSQSQVARSQVLDIYALALR